MNDAFQIAATGMYAQRQNVDAIANNLANVNTTGFKKARVSFVDLVARSAEPIDGDATFAAGHANLGVGVGVAHMARNFEPGELKQTGNTLDVAVSGDGFIEVMLPDGGKAYTRGGTLRVTPEGQLATASGHVLAPSLDVPDDVKELRISPQGVVTATTAGEARAVELGRLELVRFAAPDALQAMGDGLFRPDKAAGEAIVARAGEDGTGELRQGYLESSNVKLVDEMVGLMVAQRAYEASVKVVQAADEMLGMVNNLRK